MAKRYLTKSRFKLAMECPTKLYYTGKDKYINQNIDDNVMLQFTEMSDYERSEIEKALLKYCELDTLAMVMIYEGWKDMGK